MGDHQAVLRSLLFVPGDRSDRLAKALTLEADAIVIELEDGVRTERKPAARTSARAFMEQTDLVGRTTVVRVNGADSNFHDDDLKAIREWARLPDYVMVPKVESSDDLEPWARLYDRAGVPGGAHRPGRDASGSASALGHRAVRKAARRIELRAGGLVGRARSATWLGCALAGSHLSRDGRRGGIDSRDRWAESSVRRPRWGARTGGSST